MISGNYYNKSPLPSSLPFDAYFLRFCCTLLSVWNFGSFSMRIFLTGRPLSVLFSFRSIIEMATTYPFLISMWIEDGQFLYGKNFTPPLSKHHFINTYL